MLHPTICFAAPMKRLQLIYSSLVNSPVQFGNDLPKVACCVSTMYNPRYMDAMEKPPTRSYISTRYSLGLHGINPNLGAMERN